MINIQPVPPPPLLPLATCLPYTLPFFSESLYRLDVGNAYVNIFEPYAIVNSSGYVNYYDLSDLTVYCRLHMTLFPFDTQICQIVFSSYSYDSDQVSFFFFFLHLVLFVMLIYYSKISIKY